MEYKLIGGNNMRCTACNKELNKKEVVYTEDKRPYCQNPFQCNENHPNSVQNILARGGAVDLYTEDELENNIFDRLNISDEMKDRILKVATKPQSIRLSKYEIAYYLIALQEERELASISEAVRYCVQLAMTIEPITKGQPPAQPQGEPTPEPEQQVIEKSKGVKIVVPDIPKSVNVDWNNLPQVEPEPEKEEEEMTF